MVRSKIDYGCIVYNTVSANLLLKLESTQNMCLGTQSTITDWDSSHLISRSIMSVNYALNTFSKKPYFYKRNTLFKLLKPMTTGDPPNIPINYRKDYIFLKTLPRKIIPLILNLFVQFTYKITVEIPWNTKDIMSFYNFD